jgi:predicted PurR-regulated permease PerM
MTDRDNKDRRSAGQGFIIFAALIIIAAGLKSAQAIVVPMLLAVFIATIAATPMFWFKAKGMSNGLALGSVVLAIFLGLGADRRTAHPEHIGFLSQTTLLPRTANHLAK